MCVFTCVCVLVGRSVWLAPGLHTYTDFISTKPGGRMGHEPSKNLLHLAWLEVDPGIFNPLSVQNAKQQLSSWSRLFFQGHKYQHCNKINGFFPKLKDLLYVCVSLTPPMLHLPSVPAWCVDVPEVHTVTAAVELASTGPKGRVWSGSGFQLGSLQLRCNSVTANWATSG